MAIEQMNNHYSMNNPASVYDEEALTALELAGRLGKKIIEIIDLVNKNELTIDEAVKQFWKDYNEAKEYMVDNLPDFVENSVENLKNSGALETMLVKLIEDTKVDKGGIEQITYTMLSQQVKEMFTGGNTPVVGADSVSTSNIVDNAVIENKLRRDLRQVEFVTTEMGDYFKPLLIMNTETRTAHINPEYTASFILNTREKSSTINPADIVVNTTGWTSNNPDIYFNPDNKELKVANGTRGTAHENYLLVGSVKTYGYSASSVIPVELNGQFYMGNRTPSIKQLPLQIRDAKLYYNDKHLFTVNSAVFDVNFDTQTVTILRDGNIQLSTEDYIYTMSLPKLTVVCSADAFSGSHAQVYYNPAINTLYFVKTQNVFLASYANCLYIGLVTKPTVSQSSTCVIPYTINGKYYVHPDTYERARADLILSNSVEADSPVVAKVDFKKRRMIIPANTKMTVGINSYYAHINGGEALTKDLEVPFGSTDSSHQYLVGGENGIMFIPYEQFRSMSNSRDFNQLYYFGYVNETTKDIHLRCKAEKLRTLLVLGDSISTFEGTMPSHHTVYYTAGKGNVNYWTQTWWGRVANRCGLKPLVNMSWSGLRVTPRSGNAERDAVYLADNALVYTQDEKPDIVLVYLGVNDYNHNHEIGEWDRKTQIDLTYDCTQKHYFMESYAKTVATLQRSFPDAEIYCMTIPMCERHGIALNTTGVPEVNELGLALWDYNDAIKKVCEALNATVIDTASCKFNALNASKYFLDYNSSSFGYLHPNAEGMKVIANKVIKALLDTKECE